MNKTAMCVALVVAMLMVLSGFVSSASAAGGGFGGSSSLGGNISGQDGYPSLNSGSWVSSGGNVNGNFGIQLNADKVSLENAYWSFSANNWDSSRWTASCYLYGYRNGSTWGQNQNWSQQVDQDGLSISASLGASYYSYNPNQGQIDSLLAQAAQLQAQLTKLVPNSSDYQLTSLQLQLVQIQLSSLASSYKHVLSVYGAFDIEPSELESSNFRYWETTQAWYEYPNGYDQPPVITQVPVWRAEYDMYGQFLPDTPEHSMSGNQAELSVTATPEPATLAFLAIGGIGLVVRRIRRRTA
jgi:hypothetical protein